MGRKKGRKGRGKLVEKLRRRGGFRRRSSLLRVLIFMQDEVDGRFGTTSCATRIESTTSFFSSRNHFSFLFRNDFYDLHVSSFASFAIHPSPIES